MTNVLPTQETLDRLADRIERAFLLRRNNWYRGCSTARVWSVAATILWETHRGDPTIPLDPELFVASQPLSPTFADPWSSLALPEAGQRYRQNVLEIIRRLRNELKRELRLVENLVRQGRASGCWSVRRTPVYRPWGFMLRPTGQARPDLARKLRQSAMEQHNCCPLYRSACLL